MEKYFTGIRVCVKIYTSEKLLSRRCSYMAVKIRMKRVGSKRNPVYRIVVADSRSPRDGRNIEQIGTYPPVSNPVNVENDEEKALNWMKNRSQRSDTVRNL